MKRLAFHPAVEDDIDEARVWYESRRAGLGDAFSDRVDEAFAYIGRSRVHPAVIHREVRVWQVERFPYAVYYRVEANRIAVLAVMHTSRDPSAWQSRG